MTIFLPANLNAFIFLKRVSHFDEETSLSLCLNIYEVKYLGESSRICNAIFGVGLWDLLIRNVGSTSKFLWKDNRKIEMNSDLELVSNPIGSSK